MSVPVLSVAAKCGVVLLLLGWHPARGQTAEEVVVDPLADEATEFLQLATELVRLEMTLPAAEALRRVDTARLHDGQREAFVGLMETVMLGAKSAYPELRAKAQGWDPSLYEQFPKFRLVAAELYLQEGRVSDALEQWRLAFEAMPKLHRGLFLAAVKRLLSVSREVFRWDPGVQK